MSVKPIEDMDFKELRSEVQQLRDDLAKMKRFYEDLFYNLDTDNFSPRLVLENKNMRTTVEATDEGLKTKVSAEDVDKKIESEYSQFEQTAESISSEVRKIVNLSAATVVRNEGQFDDTEKLYAISRDDGGYDYYYYNSISGGWEPINEESIYSFFEQIDDGFRLKGTVSIVGNLVRSSDQEGNVIEINKGFLNIIPSGSDIPKLQMGFTDVDGYENPYILIGAGDGNFQASLIGIPIKSSSGIIHKNSNGMILAYTPQDPSGIMGIQFLEDGEVMKFMGNVDFTDARSVEFGSNSPVAVFG